jgi:hypothetical protein
VRKKLAASQSQKSYIIEEGLEEKTRGFIDPIS